MPMTIHRDGKAPMIVSLKTAFAQLSDDTDICDLLSQVRLGACVPVTLRDGTTAEISATSRPMQLALPGHTGQGLVLPDRRAFALECNLLFEVDAMIYCAAANKAEASRLANDVLMGDRLPDRSFQIEIDREALAETFSRLDRTMQMGSSPHELGTKAVVINRIEER